MTVERDGGENLSSWTHQGSLQGKVAIPYQKTCRLVLLEDYEGFFITIPFGEGDVSRRNLDGNGGHSGQVFR